jgi:hypothetical protein
MPSYDLTRHATNFRKQYAGVRMQQGRILTDDDFNEHARLEAERERRTLTEVIGPAGTPDSGFAISNPTTTGGSLDFTIGAGTMYVGGLRLEMAEPETYLLQHDWLRRPAITTPDAERLDLVYLEVWNQPVTAVEDEELFEVGLSSGDTSARNYTVRRVRVAEGIGEENCQEAWSEFLDSLSGEGTLNDENELVTDATLTVTYDPPSNPGDLCNPPVAGGYLGAENQAIRVQVVDDDTFNWGFNNVTPLYRVTVRTNEAGERRLIHMITEPRDAAHWPLAGQVIELLPWSSVLPNGEKIAETSGFLARVDGSWNPDAGVPPGEFSIATAVPAGFGEEWQDRSDAGDLDDNVYLYMRVWDRGSDTASPVQIPITPAAPLGNTGLRVTFGGAQRRATDHWIIAARPESPNQVVPWDFDEGRPPHGYRRFLAPLAVIRWQPVTGGAVTGDVIDDCRPPFLPLTRLRGCCTFTVGDGDTSFGQFTSIQQAINSLPPAGGEICVLPGTYEENLTIDGRNAVYLHGCGLRTRITGAPGVNQPIITLANAQGIRIANLAIISPGNIGILGAAMANRPGPLTNITLEKLYIECSGREAIQLRAQRAVNVLSCFINVLGLGRNLSVTDAAGKFPAVFVRADDVLIESNTIVCAEGVPRFQAPLGGLQIGGGSDRVVVRRNRIEGGNGHGIVLGSIRFVPAANVPGLTANPENFFNGGANQVLIGWVTFDEDGCPEIDPLPQDPPGPDGQPLRPFSEGALQDIRIVDNQIYRMGMCGISVARFGTAEARILISNLTIEWNRIERSMALTLITPAFVPALFAAFGGITLLDVEDLVCRWNRIQENGVGNGDPITGIFVGAGEAVLLEGNRVVGNGPPAGAANVKLFGFRGGILVRANVLTTAAYALTAETLRAGIPAARLHGNVVETGFGPALLLLARGPVAVADNHFASRGLPPRPTGTANTGLTQNAVQAAVVIMNIGISTEIQGLLGLLSTAAGGAGAFDDTLVAPAASPPRIPPGLVLFNDNQVTLDTIAATASQAFCNVFLYALDDVSFCANQMTCATRELLASDGVVFAWSTRTTDNRFQEIPLRALMSGFTFAPLNFTSQNIGTHCILAYPSAKTVGTPNIPLLFPADRCDQLRAALPQLLQGLFQ